MMPGMLFDNEKMVAEIIGDESPTPEKNGEGDENLDADFLAAYHASGDDMIKAIQAGDPKKFTSGLLSFMRIANRQND